MSKQTLSLLFIFFANSICAAPELAFQIIDESTHDSQMFTQGLELDGDEMIESSGLYGQSSIRRYKLANGKVLQEQGLPKTQFAEGLTLVGQYIFLLTWREQQLYILDKKNLKPLFKLSYAGEGWGLAFDGTHLIMSDGSNKLYYRDKKNFHLKRTLDVNDNGTPINALNELEYAKQTIWANVWRKDIILQIDPLTGKVIAEINLGSLVSKNGDNISHVLNGIAYDKSKDAFWITGKNWSKKYLIKVNPR